MGSHTPLTVYDFMARYKVTRRTAAEWLDNQVVFGNFKKTKKCINGRWVNQYTAIELESAPSPAPTGRVRRRSSD